MAAHHTTTYASRGSVQEDAVRVLAFSGRLTENSASEEKYQQLRADIDEGIRKFVFDLSQVSDLDSAGIGLLVACLATARRANAQLRLAAPSNRILYCLLITRLDAVFPVFETVEAAMA